MDPGDTTVQVLKAVDSHVESDVNAVVAVFILQKPGEGFASDARQKARLHLDDRNGLAKLAHDSRGFEADVAATNDDNPVRLGQFLLKQIYVGPAADVMHTGKVVARALQTPRLPAGGPNELSIAKDPPVIEADLMGRARGFDD
jgi:hypothetical protein